MVTSTIAISVEWRGRSLVGGCLKTEEGLEATNRGTLESFALKGSEK